MIFRYPSYYEEFSCIADRCEDTCCAGWEIDIDDESYADYQTVPGPFGEELRSLIKTYDPESEDVYETHGFILREDKRCPFLKDSGLCRLYQELGEEALCDVCTYTPRNILEYGGERELALSASCPEAGRLIFGKKDPIRFVEKEIEEALDFEETEEEMILANRIRKARDEEIRILQNRQISIQKRIQYFLVFAEQVQEALNENRTEQIAVFIKESQNNRLNIPADESDEAEKADKIYDNFLYRMRLFTGLESIREDWQEVLERLHAEYILPEDGKEKYIKNQLDFMKKAEKEDFVHEYEHLMVYYAFMCLARCVDDYDFIGKAKLCVISFLMIRDMQMINEGSKRQQMVRIYAKEIEHSEENLDILAEEFIFEENFSKDSLIFVVA